MVHVTDAGKGKDMRVRWLAAIAGIAFAGAAFAQEKVSFRLAWIKTATNAAPYYYALAKGLYAAEGLDVTVLEGKGSPLNVQLVASGDVMIASADLAIVAKSIEKDIPVRAVFGELQENAMVVISMAAKPIRTPKELEGKTILGSAATSYTRLLPALCRKNGADCSKVTVRNTQPPFEPFFLSGQGDAMLGLFADNVPKLEASGAKVHALRYSEFGISVMANGLIVRNDTLQNRPATIQKFVRATQKAWTAMRDNPDEVVDAWMKVVEKGDRATYAAIAKNATSIMHTRHSRGRPAGWMATEDWKQMLEVLKSVDEIDKVLPLERYFTNSLTE